MSKPKTVELSAYAKKVQKWYESGQWPLSWVRNAVVKGKITADEFEVITGIPYNE